MRGDQVSVAHLQEIAASADDLAEQILEARTRLRRTTDERRHRAGFLFEDAAADCYRVARELRAAAHALEVPPGLRKS